MRLRPVAALVALLAAALVLTAGCSGSGSSDGSVPPPGAAKVAVDTPALQQLKATAAIESCVPGTASSKLPDLTLPCLGGGPAVDLSSLKGPLIINLWQSNCGPCRLEMPVLQQFHETYGDQVRILGVDLLDTAPDVALQQAAERGATYPQVADPGGDLLTEAAFAKVKGVPWLAFVDASGEVRSLHPGGVRSLDELVGLVEDSLGIGLTAA